MSRSPALSSPLRVGSASAPAPWLYRTLRGPVRAALARWFDFTVQGLAHVPAAGPYIVAANHHNYLDGLVLAAALPAPIGFIVMPRVYRATPLHPAFHRHIGSIPIALERPDISALRAALTRLERGGVVGIFPEGPFSLNGRLERGQPGVALLALHSAVPVVPAAIRGTFEALHGRRAYVPRRARLGVQFGPPRQFARETVRTRQARLDVTRRIMGDIAALLS